mgnify:CR=1 FL=1
MRSSSMSATWRHMCSMHRSMIECSGIRCDHGGWCRRPRGCLRSSGDSVLLDVIRLMTHGPGLGRLRADHLHNTNGHRMIFTMTRSIGARRMSRYLQVSVESLLIDALDLGVEHLLQGVAVDLRESSLELRGEGSLFVLVQEHVWVDRRRNGEAAGWRRRWLLSALALLLELLPGKLPLLLTEPLVYLVLQQWVMLHNLDDAVAMRVE